MFLFLYAFFFCWIILMSFRVDTLEFIWFGFLLATGTTWSDLKRFEKQKRKCSYLIQNFLMFKLTMGIWRHHELFKEFLRFWSFKIVHNLTFKSRFLRFKTGMDFFSHPKACYGQRRHLIWLVKTLLFFEFCSASLLKKIQNWAKSAPVKGDASGRNKL